MAEVAGARQLPSFCFAKPWLPCSGNPDKPWGRSWQVKRRWVKNRVQVSERWKAEASIVSCPLFRFLNLGVTPWSLCHIVSIPPFCLFLINAIVYDTFACRLCVKACQEIVATRTIFFVIFQIWQNEKAYFFRAFKLKLRCFSSTVLYLLELGKHEQEQVTGKVRYLVARI